MNGIILNDKIYEAIPRGSYHCSDCDLFDQCKENPVGYSALCLPSLHHHRVIFRHSQTLTNKIQQ